MDAPWIPLPTRALTYSTKEPITLLKALKGTENGLDLKCASGIFRFAVDDNNKKTELASSTSSFVTGEWVHVVIIRDAYKKKLWLYKNGMLNTQVNDNTTGIACDLPLVHRQLGFYEYAILWRNR